MPLFPITDFAIAEIEAVLDAAFGADRFGRTAYRIRSGTEMVSALSFGMAADEAAQGGKDGQGTRGPLIGTIQCWPVQLNPASGDPAPLVMVGPVAVMPERQGEYIGHALMDAMIAAADATGAPPLMLIGDPEYYGRWGFVDDRTGGWDAPGPFERRRLLMRDTRATPLPDRGMLGPRIG